jgi:hypothetical protein
MPGSEVNPLVQELELHVTGIPPQELAKARRDFTYLGAAKVPFVVPDTVKLAVAAEVLNLAEDGVRRELRSKGDRRLVAQDAQHPARRRFERSTAIHRIYSNPGLLAALAEVAGEPVHTDTTMHRVYRCAAAARRS